MMFSSTKLLALTLIDCVAASPIELYKRGQNVIIGYRIVSAGQARRYNDAGTLTDDPNLIGVQIGYGVYTTPSRGDWPGGNNPWYCVILADSDAVTRISKAWVPQQYEEGTDLWFNPAAVDNYITQLNDLWDSAKTLRLSIIDGLGWDIRS